MSYYYTRDHEWISVNGTSHDTIATVGITDYAQVQLGDIVFVEAPPKGTQLVKGKECAVVESVKAASDIFAPVSGEVVEPNAHLDGEPSLVNSAPENEGWLFRMVLADSTELEGLMDQHEYKNYVAGL